MRADRTHHEKVYPDLGDRIGKFKADLKLPTSTVVRKHVTYGGCYVMDDDAYFDLKEAVASNFRIHPSEVIIVGSAKLGFSIKREKRYCKFGDTSDVDVTIVSPNLFDSIWQSAFNFQHSGGLWPNEHRFASYLLRGWIRPDKLPPAKAFEQCRDWWDFFTALTNSQKYGSFKIKGGLYRTWHFLETYQSICVDQCKQEIV